MVEMFESEFDDVALSASLAATRDPVTWRLDIGYQEITARAVNTSIANMGAGEGSLPTEEAEALIEQFSFERLLNQGEISVPRYQSIVLTIPQTRAAVASSFSETYFPSQLSYSSNELPSLPTSHTYPP